MMKSFADYVNMKLLTEAPLPGGPPGGAPGGIASPAGLPPGGPPPGGPPGMGGPPPAMGGGLGGLGAPPGMGGPPGGMGGQPPMKLKTPDVWSVLEKMLGMEGEHKVNN